MPSELPALLCRLRAVTWTRDGVTYVVRKTKPPTVIARGRTERELIRKLQKMTK